MELASALGEQTKTARTARGRKSEKNNFWLTFVMERLQFKEKKFHLSE
jgi:hypothetical protein